jgi:uncharacterized protein (DUF697 family)
MSTTAAAPVPALTEDQMDSGATSIIRKHMLWAMGAGLVPIPWVDMAAIAGVQLKMLNELAEKYELQFSESRGKAIIGTLVGSVVPGQMATGLLGGLVKMIPFVGFVTIPAFAGASTYALGKVFAQHFASGGTFLNFNPDSTRKHFQEYFEKGKAEAANLAQQAGVTA